MEPSNPNFNTIPELPAPMDGSLNSPEKTATPESAGNATTRPPMVNPASNLPARPLNLPPEPSHTEPTAQASRPDDNLIADDADLIEKEWVVKAKAIVAQTKDDPYNQNKSMTRVKADYLKKRYNKDLKISEG